MMRPTLILGDEPRIIVPIARSLHRQGIPVLVAALDSEARIIRSRAVPRSFRVENSSALLDLIRRENVDWVIPSSDSALALVARYGELSQAAMLSCPPPAAVARVLDKQRTMQAAAECGIETPRGHNLKSLEDLRTARRSLRFPLIAKPASKHAGAAFKIRYYADFERLERDFASDPDYPAKYLLQEYAAGEGAGVELLMHDGRPLATFAHRRILEYPCSGGVSVLAVAEPVEPDLLEMSVRLLNHLGWSGVAMVEFRYDRRARRAILMEVNGRYWGSLGLSIAAGVDFPYADWQRAHGLPLSAAIDGRPRVRARWTAGVLLRIQDAFTPKDDGMPRPARSLELLRSLAALRPGVRDMLWSWRDPRPALDEIKRTAFALARRVVSAALRRALPAPLLRRLKTYRSLEPGASGAYARCQLRRALSISSRPLPRDVHSVVFVCHGNIVRSPMAEALFRQISAIPARSAGLRVVPGRAADPRASRVAPEFGVTLDHHAAAPLTAAMVREAGVIFVMDELNEARLLNRFPEARGKVRLLGEFAPRRLEGDVIADPYEGTEEDIRECFRTLDACINEIAARLESTAANRRIQATG
jgi:protein-tyrosine-phosphatase/predicted ATP-grasp superfamily ATP-dependent carboligase